jgi:hypothetical protein
MRVLNWQVSVALVPALDLRAPLTLVRRHCDRLLLSGELRFLVDLKAKLVLVQLLTLATAEDLLLQPIKLVTKLRVLFSENVNQF